MRTEQEIRDYIEDLRVISKFVREQGEKDKDQFAVGTSEEMVAAIVALRWVLGEDIDISKLKSIANSIRGTN